MPKVILIAEDEPVIAVDMRNVIQRLGYEVPPPLQSAEDLLEAAGKTRPDLVIMDIRLKGRVDGIEASKQIHDSLDIPVIYLTAHSDEPTFRRAMETNPYAYLIKPVETRELHTAIETALHRHAMECRLRESEGRYRLLADECCDVVVLSNLEGIIEYASPTLERVTGWPAEEIVGKDLYTKIHPDDRTVSMNALVRSTREGIDTMVQNRFLKKDGTYIWMESSTRVVLDAAGNPHSLRVSARDITSRKKTEEDLREREQIFRVIFESAAIGVARIGRDARFLETNPFLQQFLGYSAEEINNLSAIEVTHPEDHESDRGLYRELLEGKRDLLRQDRRFIRKDGSIAWGRISGSLVKDHKGTVLYGVAIIDDITDRKRIEEQEEAARKALRESERLYRLLAENSSDVIWTMGLDGKFTYASPSLTALSGFTPDEALAIPFEKYVLPQYVPVVLSELEREMKMPPEERSKSRVIEIQQYAKDGTAIDIEVTTTWITDEKGTIIGLQGSTRDIRNRKRMEKALRESEERLLLITENMMDMVRLTDEQGVILYASPSHSFILGYRPEELGGQNIYSFTHPDDLESCIGARNSSRAGRGTARGICRIRHRDGHYLWESWMGTPLFDENGKPKGSVISAYDITEKIKAEAQKEAAQEALRKNEELLRVITDNMKDAILVVDLETFAYSYTNKYALELFNRSKDELINAEAGLTVAPDERDRMLNILADEIRNDAERDPERAREFTLHEALRSSYGDLWTENKATFIRNAEGKPTAILIISRDVTERMKTDEQIKASLHEKEILLKEIHHRVKNNFQIIASLLNLQARTITDSAALSYFRDIQSRIRSMGIIHEKLYQSHDLARIDFASYLKTLSSELNGTYGRGSRPVSIDIDAECLLLTIDQAIPCGLMVNEILTNAFKYAFRSPTGHEPQIAIRLRESTNGRVALTIRDNGMGLPEGISLKSVNTLGLSLVSLLSQQLKGKVSAIRANGTRFTISFKRQ
jgi:PAS domain S-box-containing protein